MTRHATDSHSWPLFIPSYPLLSSHGAYSPSQTYSSSEIKHIKSFAGALGISVLLEVDMPGHTASVAEAYPEFVACWKGENWTKLGNEPPSGQLKLGDLGVQGFSEEVVRSATGMMDSPYF